MVFTSTLITNIYRAEKPDFQSQNKPKSVYLFWVMMNIDSKKKMFFSENLWVLI